MYVAVAAIGSAAIGGAISSMGASDAASAQQDAADEAARIQMQMYQQSRADTAPWRKAGENALNTLTNKVNAGPGTFQQSPGYQARLEEGQRGIERATSARGGIGGGKMSKDLARYGQNYATNDYQNFLNNYYTSLAPYQSLSGEGMTMASQNAQNSLATGQGLANTYQTAGQAQAGGYINQANALTGAMGSGLNNYLAWQGTQNDNNWSAPSGSSGTWGDTNYRIRGE
jgi:hypothetical protein